MKREWQAPKLEVLDINMTMAGPGTAYPDAVFSDVDEKGVLHYGEDKLAS